MLTALNSQEVLSEIVHSKNRSCLLPSLHKPAQGYRCNFFFFSLLATSKNCSEWHERNEKSFWSEKRSCSQMHKMPTNLTFPLPRIEGVGSCGSMDRQRDSPEQEFQIAMDVWQCKLQTKVVGQVRLTGRLYKNTLKQCLGCCFFSSFNIKCFPSLTIPKKIIPMPKTTHNSLIHLKESKKKTNKKEIHSGEHLAISFRLTLTFDKNTCFVLNITV